MRISEDLVDGTTVRFVVTEREDCHWCKNRVTPQGFIPKPVWVTCTKCKGTGKRGNGRCRECNARDGYFGIHGRNPGHVIFYDDSQPVTCTHCDGNYKDYGEENWTDYVDVSFLPIEVLRRPSRTQSWQEEHLGAGIYTTVDYGRHHNLTDEQIIEPVRKEMARVQACKVVNNKEEMRLCDSIVIVTASGGYSAIAFFDEKED